MLTSLVQPAAYTFIYRFMANKSEEHPQGKLNGEVLKAFFAVEGEDGHFTYNEGHERIPDNWYKRNVLDEYTIPYFSLDNLEMASQHPEFLSVGGNTGMFFQMVDVYNTNVSQGTVDSFVGVDPADLTGGVFNGATLLEGYVVDSLTQWVESLLTKRRSNNLACFAMQAAVQQLPDVLSGVLTDDGSRISQLTSSLGCPKLNNIDKDQFSKYPGYTNS
jgi:hypothetical protein